MAKKDSSSYKEGLGMDLKREYHMEHVEVFVKS